MTDYIRTECPYCHTQFKVSLSQASTAKSSARCAQCRNIFSIKNNLATKSQKVNASTSSANSSDISPVDSVNHTHDSDNDPTYSEDFLIHDDMDLDSDDNDLEVLPDIDNDWAFESSFNNNDANNINNPFHNSTYPSEEEGVSPEDESWLQALLAEEEEERLAHEESYLNPATENELTELLDDLGVDSSEDPTVDKKSVLPLIDKRLQSTEKHSSISQSSLASNLLWGIGCAALLLLLLAQYTVFNLDTLIKDPKQQVRVESFCRLVNCVLPNVDIAQIIVSHQTHKPNDNFPQSSDIMAAIDNISHTEQLLPNLKVQIYGGDKIVGEFVAEPIEYLVTPQRIIGPSQITLFMLTVDIAPSTISRVQITPFY